MNSSFKKRLSKKSVFLVLFLSFLSSPLFFYYLFDVVIPFFVVVSMHALWLVSFVFDMGITLQNRHLIKQHESNIVFQSLYARYHTVTAVLIQVLIEISFVLLMPFLFDENDFVIDIQASSLIALMIAVLHFSAWYHNKKTIRMIRKNKPNLI